MTYLYLFIFISSITIQGKVKSLKLIGDVNVILKQMCEECNYTYIDNNNILKSDLWKDGLHLRDQGLTKLGNNIINSINNSLC